MADQIRTTTYFRPASTGDKGGVLIYVRMNINYGESAESNLYSGPGPTCGTESGHIMEQSIFHTPPFMGISYNLTCLPLLRGVLNGQ